MQNASAVTLKMTAITLRVVHQAVNAANVVIE